MLVHFDKGHVRRDHVIWLRWYVCHVVLFCVTLTLPYEKKLSIKYDIFDKKLQ